MGQATPGSSPIASALDALPKSDEPRNQRKDMKPSERFREVLEPLPAYAQAPWMPFMRAMLVVLDELDQRLARVENMGEALVEKEKLR